MIRLLGRGILITLVAGAGVALMAPHFGAPASSATGIRIAGPTHPIEPGRNGGDDDDFGAPTPVALA